MRTESTKIGFDSYLYSCKDKIIIQGKPYTIIDGEIWDTENTGKHIGTLQQGQIIYNKN